ncbi:MAG: GNAT family N-acetyltransferase [Deltaproteobacteria bacterium]|nr:GNAT family N-acetyltransferase [Deltaproteobacteria bacterium]
MSEATIELLVPAQVELVIAHVARLWATPDEPRSRPYGSDVPFDPEVRTERYRIAWATPVNQPSWNRTWGLIVDGEVVGHCDLRGGVLASELHRATLGIALEAGHRDRGNGRALCAAAIEWAKDQQLAWIDLGVFSVNVRAAALYRKLGFIEVGVTRDRFRVDGETIDDIAMTLAL